MGVNVKKGTKAAVKTATSVQHSKTGAVVKEEIKEMVDVPPVYANVGVTAQRSINLGNYESVKIGVSIHRPCENTDEAIEECYEKCIAWVDEKITALCEANEPEKGGNAD